MWYIKVHQKYNKVIILVYQREKNMKKMSYVGLTEIWSTFARELMCGFTDFYFTQTNLLFNIKELTYDETLLKIGMSSNNTKCPYKQAYYLSK